MPSLHNLSNVGQFFMKEFPSKYLNSRRSVQTPKELLVIPRGDLGKFLFKKSVIDGFGKR